MPRQYRALPYPGKEGVFLKAPDYQTFLDQEYYGDRYLPPRLVDSKAEIAEKLLRTLLGIERLSQAAEFTLYRFSTGLGVKFAEQPVTKGSGEKERIWTVMMYYPKDGSEEPEVEITSEDAPEEDEPATPAPEKKPSRRKT